MARAQNLGRNCITSHSHAILINHAMKYLVTTYVFYFCWMLSKPTYKILFLISNNFYFM